MTRVLVHLPDNEHLEAQQIFFITILITTRVAKRIITTCRLAKEQMR
jgi:hypothetical protein